MVRATTLSMWCLRVQIPSGTPKKSARAPKGQVPVCKTENTGSTPVGRSRNHHGSLREWLNGAAVTREQAKAFQVQILGDPP